MGERQTQHKLYGFNLLGAPSEDLKPLCLLERINQTIWTPGFGLHWPIINVELGGYLFDVFDINSEKLKIETDKSWDSLRLKLSNEASAGSTVTANGSTQIDSAYVDATVLGKGFRSDVLAAKGISIQRISSTVLLHEAICLSKEKNGIFRHTITTQSKQYFVVTETLQAQSLTFFERSSFEAAAKVSAGSEPIGLKGIASIGASGYISDKTEFKSLVPRTIGLKARQIVFDSATQSFGLGGYSGNLRVRGEVVTLNEFEL